jgi:hypothetical protein
MTSPAVAATGIYYLTASLTIEVNTGDTVGCQFAPGPDEATTQQIGPAVNNTFENMALNGAVALTAGDHVIVICIDANSDATTQFGEGDLNAVLISNSTGAVSSGAKASNARSTLKLAKRASHQKGRGLRPGSAD